MHGDEPELRIARTREATAEVAPFPDDAALLRALLDAVSARARAAIAYRQWLGLLSRRGDAAAALSLDGDRIDALLDGEAGPPPEAVLAVAAAAAHVESAFAARAAATDEDTGPLARALRRWSLPPPSILLLGALLAAELSPRLARVLAYLGGDASRAGVTGDAAAALFGDGVPGALALDAQLAPGAPLFDLGLVAARPIDQPLLRRTLGIAPRVAHLARGVLALDPALAHALTLVTPVPAPVIPAPALEAQIEAVLRMSPRALGMVHAAREASPAERIADVAAQRGLALWRVDVRALADEGLERAVIREALLLGAALLVRVEVPGPGRDSWRVTRLLDRLAARVPIFIDADDRADLEPLWSSPVIPIELGPLEADERAEVWTEALGPGARAVDLDRLRRVRLPVEAMRRTADALAALSGAVSGALPGALSGAVSETGGRVPLLALTVAQVMRESALARVAPRELAALEVPAALRDRLAAVCTAARGRERTVISLVGRSAASKLELAAALAGALEAPARVLDFGRLADRVPELERGLTELLRFAAAGGTAILDASEPLPPLRGFTAGPEVDLLVRRLATATGVVILLARDPSAIAPVVQRFVTEPLDLTPFDVPGR